MRIKNGHKKEKSSKVVTESALSYTLCILTFSAPERRAKNKYTKKISPSSACADNKPFSVNYPSAEREESTNQNAYCQRKLMTGVTPQNKSRSLGLSYGARACILFRLPKCFNLHSSD